MLKPVIATLILLTTVFINTVSANEVSEEKSNIIFDQFWISEPPPVAKGTAGYGIIKNTGNKADTLTHVCSEDAMVMFHKTDIVNGMAKMLHLSNTVIEPHSEIKLEPMSYHLMFSDLTPNRFVEGQTITLYFEFEHAGRIAVKVPVRSAW